LFDAVTRITDESKKVEPFIYRRKQDDFIDVHPLLELLKKPNLKQTYSEFAEEAHQYQLVTGNSYIIATSKTPTSPVYELFNASPEYISITGSSPDSTPLVYQYTQLSHQDSTFHPQEIKGLIRYFTRDGRKEIIHWKKPDLLKSRAVYYGMSPVTPLWLEIEQYLKASNHNLSMLLRGVTSAGIFTAEGRLGNDQRTALREQLDKYHAGANNAGRTIVIDGGMKFEQTSFSNRDMDYEKMQDRVTKNIYKAYKIPLPLIAAETMTYSNREVAKLDLYDNAVLPLAGSFFDKIHQYLMFRYEKDPYNFVIKYEESKVSALAVRRFETLNRQRTLGIFSTNELRTELGFENAIGGSDVYGASGSGIPIAKVPDGTEDLESLQEDLNESDDIGDVDDADDADSKKSALSFFHAAKSMKNKDGSDAFTIDELQKIWQS